MKKFITLLLALILAFSLISCGKTADGEGDGDGETGGIPANTVFGIDDLDGKKIGVQLGTTGDIYVTDECPNSTIERYSKGADAVLALKQGKIDCVVIDDEPAKVFVSQNDDLMILDEPFAEEEYAIAIKKGNDDLRAKIDDALQQLMDNGTLQKIKDNYIGDNTGNSPYVSPADVDRSNGTLVVATNAEFPPYEFMDGDNIVGLDMEMAQAVCDILGMELKIENMAFDSILAAIESGKADVGIAAMTATDERRQSVDFSLSYMTAKQVIIVRK